MTVKVEDKACELEQQFNSNNNNNSINNSNNSHFRTATAVQAVADQQKTGISGLDSVVQRLIDKKMGRRKQNAPQRTGWEPEERENAGGTQNEAENGQTDGGANNQLGQDAGSESGGSDSSDRDVTMPTLESLEPDVTNGTSKTSTDSDTVNMLKQAAAAAAAMGNPLLGRSAAAGTGSASSEADMMATLLKTNPALMLNPALFNLNPSMYAAQLAQLQLMSQLQQGNNSGGGGSVEAMRRLASASSAFGPSEQSDLGNPLAQVRKRKYEDADEHSPAASAAASAAALAGVLNLSAASAPAKSPSRLAESPLDLSGSKKHGFPDLNLSPGGHAKIPKLANADNDKLSAALGAWPFLHPLLASGSLTPEALARL